MQNTYKQFKTPTKANLVSILCTNWNRKNTYSSCLVKKIIRYSLYVRRDTIGLALARNAVSIGKTGSICVRLRNCRGHPSTLFSRQRVLHATKRTGGIGKVDNSAGDKVEIMICDIKSYECAMFYMMAFNPIDKLTYVLGRTYPYLWTYTDTSITYHGQRYVVN